MPERLIDNPTHWLEREEETRSLVELMRNPEAALAKVADEYGQRAELAGDRQTR